MSTSRPCAVCGRQCNKSEFVDQINGWLHTGKCTDLEWQRRQRIHDEEVLAREKETRDKFICPVCRAIIGEYCITPKGKIRGNHLRRRPKK